LSCASVILLLTMPPEQKTDFHFTVDQKSYRRRDFTIGGNKPCLSTIVHIPAGATEEAQYEVLYKGPIISTMAKIEEVIREVLATAASSQR
jgi:hypothetical protein